MYFVQISLSDKVFLSSIVGINIQHKNFQDI